MEPEVRYCVHKIPPLGPILSQMNIDRNFVSYLRYILILSSIQRLVIPGLPTRISYVFLTYSMHATYSISLS